MFNRSPAARRAAWAPWQAQLGFFDLVDAASITAMRRSRSATRAVRSPLPLAAPNDASSRISISEFSDRPARSASACSLSFRSAGIRRPNGFISLPMASQCSQNSLTSVDTPCNYGFTVVTRCFYLRARYESIHYTLRSENAARNSSMAAIPGQQQFTLPERRDCSDSRRCTRTGTAAKNRLTGHKKRNARRCTAERFRYPFAKGHSNE